MAYNYKPRNRYYAANGVPTEDVEEATFAKWLDLKHFMHTHFSNETFTKSWSQKRKMKNLGVHSGLPDHLVLVKAKDGCLYPTYVEMKRVKGGVISDAQFMWIRALKMAGQFATVCEGADEAIEYIKAIAARDADKIIKIEAKFDKKYEKWTKKQEKQENSLPY